MLQHRDTKEGEGRLGAGRDRDTQSGFAHSGDLARDGGEASGVTGVKDRFSDMSLFCYNSP